MTAGTYHQATILTYGVDDRGNLMELKDNCDGTWTDLYNERMLTDEMVRLWYAWMFEMGIVVSLDQMPAPAQVER